jgi:hypothetical protein
MVKRLCESLQFNYDTPASGKWESTRFTKIMIRRSI